VRNVLTAAIRKKSPLQRHGNILLFAIALTFDTFSQLCHTTSPHDSAFTAKRAQRKIHYSDKEKQSVEASQAFSGWIFDWWQSD